MAFGVDSLDDSSFVNLKFLLVILATLYLVIGAVVNHRKISQFAGPPQASFSRMWLFWQAARDRSHFAQREALTKYGSPCRIGPNLLVTDDADLIRRLSSPKSQWTRSAWYDAVRLDPRRDTVFSTRSEQNHADLRFKEIGAYSGRDIDNIESDVDRTILDFLGLIRESAGQSIDFAEVSQLFTLDVLSRIAFGKCFGMLAAGRDIFGYSKATADFLRLNELMQNHGVFRWLISNSLVQKIAAPKETDASGLGRLVKFARDRVDERFRAAGGTANNCRQDMIGHFMAQGLDQLQCEAEANLQIIAGSDSTATVLRSTLFLLTGSPSMYSKLKAEVDQAVASGLVSRPVITFKETKKLAYLQACIWEGLCMYPPLFGMKMKLAPKGGDTIAGIYYPEGTEIGICESAMCRNRKEWGEDSDQFRPDRWIEADERTRRRYENIVSCVFGSGKWTCVYGSLGKHIALVELHKVLFELMRHLEWAIADRMRGINMVGHSIWLQTDMFMTSYPRAVGD